MAEEYNHTHTHNRLIGGTKWWDSSSAAAAAVTSSSLSTLQMISPQGHDIVSGSGFRSSIYGSDQTPMKGFSLDQFSHTSSVDSCGGLASPAPGMFQVFMEPPPLLQSSPGYGGGYVDNQPGPGSGSNSLLDTSNNNFNWNNKVVQEIPQLFRPQHHQQQQQQFFNSNGGCFWETAVEEEEARPAVFFPVEPAMAAPATFHDKHHHKNNTMAVKSTTTGTMRKSSLGSNRTTTTGATSTASTGGGATKRSRNEASSTMPPFKVRKEKMGDRITALQQLVSPFGKTDTASVLSESIEYIKFLHEQVNVLSTPYLKSGASLQLQQQGHNVSKDMKKDLRSRGLCLVPVSSTFPVAHESAVDFWTPTFGSGTFR